MRPFSIFKKENSGFFPHRLQSKKMVNVRDTFNDDQQKGLPEESGQTEPLCCQRNSALALANIYETPTILITRRTPFAQFNFALGKSKDKEIKRLHYTIEPSWPSPVELVDFPFFFAKKVKKCRFANFSLQLTVIAVASCFIYLQCVIRSTDNWK